MSKCDAKLIQSCKYLKHLSDRCGVESFCSNDADLSALLREAADALTLVSMRGDTDEKGVPLAAKVPS